MIATEHSRVHPAYRERLRACGLDSVRGALTRCEGTIVAWSRTTDTLYVADPNGRPGFYVKRHFFPTWIKRLRGTFRGVFFGAHRGRAEYDALTALRAVGVSTVRPIAYGCRRIAHFVVACYLITEEVPDAVNLTTFAQEVASGSRSVSQAVRREMAQAFAAELADMHGRGISHGNLFWRNVLVRPGPDGHPEFFLLDVQPMTRWERMQASQPWWIRELAQTAVSARPFTTRTERLRFLHAYLGEPRLKSERKAEAHAIEALTATWEAHEHRRIRFNALFNRWNQQLRSEDALEHAQLPRVGLTP